MTQQPFRALVVDDELPVRTILMRALRNVGFECIEAGDGEEARERLAEASFHLVDD